MPLGRTQYLERSRLHERIAFVANTSIGFSKKHSFYHHETCNSHAQLSEKIVAGMAFTPCPEGHLGTGSRPGRHPSRCKTKNPKKQTTYYCSPRSPLSIRALRFSGDGKTEKSLERPHRRGGEDDGEEDEDEETLFAQAPPDGFPRPPNPRSPRMSGNALRRLGRPPPL